MRLILSLFLLAIRDTFNQIRGLPVLQVPVRTARTCRQSSTEFAMNKLQTFEQFLTTSSMELSPLTLLLNLFIAAILASVLSAVYQKCGTALSNRKAFGGNFFLIATTTMLIITIVKSSLALSLGLVGALSIVRFRTAIKEPEELAYMFLCIAVGLGMGADQRLITVVAFFAILVFIMIRHAFGSKTPGEANLYMTISGEPPSSLSLDSIVDILTRHCKSVEMKRFDENPELQEVAFFIEFKDFENMNQARAALKEKDSQVRISILDNLGEFM